MRDFFIIALEWVIHVFVVLAIVLLFVLATMVATGVWQMPVTLPGGVGNTGPLAGLALFFAGGFFLILIAGMLYLGFGIYQNTRRMAQALENRLVK